eukprot:scaffold9088_cov117-Skeletonema_dohrnii-CCMP3373.AAC.7
MPPSKDKAGAVLIVRHPSPWFVVVDLVHQTTEKLPAGSSSSSSCMYVSMRSLPIQSDVGGKSRPTLSRQKDRNLWAFHVTSSRSLKSRLLLMKSTTLLLDTNPTTSTTTTLV